MNASLQKRNTLGSDSCFAAEDLPETLHDVLDNPDQRTEFMAFLKARLANESLLFYESIEMYEQLDNEQRRQKAGMLPNVIVCNCFFTTFVHFRKKNGGRVRCRRI